MQRAQKRLVQRIQFLSGVLGQRMPVLVHNNIHDFWQALRSTGSVILILVDLAKSFKVSLLGNYRSLLPYWEREPLSVSSAWSGG